MSIGEWKVTLTIQWWLVAPPLNWYSARNLHWHYIVPVQAHRTIPECQTSMCSICLANPNSKSQLDNLKLKTISFLQTCMTKVNTSFQASTAWSVFVDLVKILSEKFRLSSTYWKMSGMMKLVFLPQSLVRNIKSRLLYDEANCIIPDIFKIIDEDLDSYERILVVQWYILDKK